MKEKLIVALDVSTRKEALQLAEKLWDSVGAFKIGMQLYNSEGPDIIKDIQELGGKVFVDLKFHDFKEGDIIEAYAMQQVQPA